MDKNGFQAAIWVDSWFGQVPGFLYLYARFPVLGHDNFAACSEYEIVPSEVVMSADSGRLTSKPFAGGVTASGSVWIQRNRKVQLSWPEFNEPVAISRDAINEFPLEELARHYADWVRVWALLQQPHNFTAQEFEIIQQLRLLPAIAPRRRGRPRFDPLAVARFVMGFLENAHLPVNDRRAALGINIQKEKRLIRRAKDLGFLLYENRRWHPGEYLNRAVQIPST